MKLLYKGKAKTVYEYDKDTCVIEFRDDITAFDAVKKNTIPKKGYYNCQISSKLFALLEKNGIRTHYLKVDEKDGNKMFAKKVDIIKLEVIVRNIAAGSITKMYPIPERTEFKEPIVVLDYKDDKYHDPMVNEDIAVALNLASRDELAQIRAVALNVNEVLRKYFDGLGILIPDFKLEFGRNKTGILVADEISPDTCRFWDKYTKKSFDKDVFRFDKGDVIAGYREIYERINKQKNT